MKLHEYKFWDWSIHLDFWTDFWDEHHTDDDRGSVSDDNRDSGSDNDDDRGSDNDDDSDSDSDDDSDSTSTSSSVSIFGALSMLRAKC